MGKHHAISIQFIHFSTYFNTTAFPCSGVLGECFKITFPYILIQEKTHLK